MLYVLEHIKGIFILCVLSVPLSLSLSAGLFTWVSNGLQMFGPEEENQCFHCVLDHLQTLRIIEWFESFNSKDFLSCGPPCNIHTTVKELLLKGFFGMLLLINKLRLLGSSCFLIRTVKIKQGQYGPHLFDFYGAIHRCPLCTDLSWQFPTARIKHERLGRNTLQWKAMEVSVDSPHPQSQQYPVSVLRPDFSFELNGSFMSVPGHYRNLSGH